MVLVNIACCIVLMQHAAHAPANFKELVACNWLAGSTTFTFLMLRTDKYQIKNISCYVLILHQVNKAIVNHDSSKLYHQEDSLAAFTKEPCYRGMLSSCDCIILWRCIHTYMRDLPKSECTDDTSSILHFGCQTTEWWLNGWNLAHELWGLWTVCHFSTIHVCQRCTCVYVEPLIRHAAVHYTEHKLIVNYS